MSQDYDPMDFYEEYSEWLCRHCDVHNKDQLIEKFEDGYMFDVFLEYRAAEIPE